MIIQPPSFVECDKEPVHICGSIQPHGCLIAVHQLSGMVEFCSANVSEFLQVKLENLLNNKLDLKQDQARNWQNILKKRANISEFSSEPWRVFELEGDVGLPTRPQEEWLVEIDSLSAAPDLPLLLNRMAVSTQKLTGYERVMIYRFEENWDGTVVAEAINSACDSFLNLRFPAEDIPSQVRDLYGRNPIRYIPCVPFEAVPILPSQNQAQLDLSSSLLRAVSPVHIEYLRNMSVGASMSISLMLDNRLWGLVACHHRSPLYVHHRVRSFLVSMANLCSQLIGARSQSAQYRKQADTRAMQLDLLGCLAAVTDIKAGLTANADRTMDLVKASGAALVDGEAISLMGATPSLDDIKNIIAHLQSPAKNEGIGASKWTAGKKAVACNETRNLVPALGGSSLANATGFLAVPASENERSWLIWFRPEIISAVHWAGEPTKHRSADDQRLHPRRSFKLWKEKVVGKCQPWTAEEIDSAAVLAQYVGQRLQAESQFNDALEAAGRPMLVSDSTGRIRSHNRAFLSLLGASDPILKEQTIQQLLQTGTTAASIERTDGRRIPVEIAQTPMSTPEGIFALTSIADVSEKRFAELERERLNLALQDSNQKMEQFVDTIAHDLSAPLSSISRLAQFIEYDIGANADGQLLENIRSLKRRAERMRDQLKAFLDYSKAGHIRAVPELVDCDEMARALVDSLTKGEDIQFTYSGLPVFTTVRAPLEHVMHNLIINAIKHAGNKAEHISVCAVDEGNRYRFSVQDDGDGIPLEYQEEIFLPLRSLKRGGDSIEPNHGMGLAFVKRIVEQSGGTIKLESEPGKGAKFSFTWQKNWEPDLETKTWKIPR